MAKQLFVTKDSLQQLLDSDNPKKVEAVIGRALSALYDYQTADEQNSDATLNHNGVGFTGADAHSGSKTAKFWMKHHKLLDWQIDMWLKKGAKGYARLAKYHTQLNKIAELKLTSQHKQV